MQCFWFLRKWYLFWETPHIIGDIKEKSKCFFLTFEWHVCCGVQRKSLWARITPMYVLYLYVHFTHLSVSPPPYTPYPRIQCLCFRLSPTKEAALFPWGFCRNRRRVFNLVAISLGNIINLSRFWMRGISLAYPFSERMWKYLCEIGTVEDYQNNNNMLVFE